MANNRRRSGDRKDGRLLHSLSAFYRFMPYIMPHRDDAQNYFSESFDIAPTDKFLRKERVEGYKGIGMLHFIIAAYIRCVSMLPGVNRFVAGRRIYARNSIDVVLMVKKGLAKDSPEQAVKLHFRPTATIYDVYDQLNEEIRKVRTQSEGNDTDKFAEFACSLPRFLLRFFILVLRIMDYFDLIPEQFLELSPFHGSMIITDLGSLRMGPVYHHIYNFGTLPVFISFGMKRHTYELDRNGHMVDKKYVDIKFVLDERIVDGQYYSKFLHAMQAIFLQPELLTVPPSKVVEDVN